MLPSSHLKLDVKRINPSTIEFVVSRSDPLLSSFDRVILLYLLLLIPLRVYAYTHIENTLSEHISDVLPLSIERLILGVPLFVFLVRVFLKLRSIKSESMLVVEGFGVQLLSRTFLGSSKRQFISSDRIEALIINEGITFHTVIFYMAIVLKEKQQMILVFENLRPRLPILEAVYKEAARLVNAGASKSVS